MASTSAGAPPEKKRKDSENRKFNSDWTDQFCFIMPEGSTKPMCLICNRKIGTVKNNDIKRHHTTTHSTFEENYPVGSKDRADKIASFLRSHSHSRKIMVQSMTLQEKNYRGIIACIMDSE